MYEFEEYLVRLDHISYIMRREDQDVYIKLISGEAFTWIVTGKHIRNMI